MKNFELELWIIRKKYGGSQKIARDVNHLKRVFMVRLVEGVGMDVRSTFHSCLGFYVREKEFFAGKKCVENF